MPAINTADFSKLLPPTIGPVLCPHCDADLSVRGAAKNTRTGIMGTLHYTNTEKRIVCSMPWGKWPNRCTTCGKKFLITGNRNHGPLKMTVP